MIEHISVRINITIRIKGTIAIFLLRIYVNYIILNQIIKKQFFRTVVIFTLEQVMGIEPT